MEGTPNGMKTRLPEKKSLEAANDPVISLTRPVTTTGWDPFEIWRTRIRGLRLRHPREGKSSTD